MMKPYCGHDMLLLITLLCILNVGSIDITMKVRLDPYSDYVSNVKFNLTSFKSFAGCLCNKRTESCSVYYNLNDLKASNTAGQEKNDMESLKDNVYICSVDQRYIKIFCRRSTNHSIPCPSIPLCQTISLLSPLTCDAGCIGFLWTLTHESLEHKTGIQTCDPGLNGSTPKTTASKPIVSHTTAWPTTVTTKPANLTSTLSTTAISNVTNKNQTQKSNDEDVKTTIIIGVTVTIIVGLALTTFVFLVCRWRKHKTGVPNHNTAMSPSEPDQLPQSPYYLNELNSNETGKSSHVYENQQVTHTDVNDQDSSTNPYENAITEP